MKVIPWNADNLYLNNDLRSSAAGNSNSDFGDDYVCSSFLSSEGVQGVKGSLCGTAWDISKAEVDR